MYFFFNDCCETYVYYVHTVYCHMLQGLRCRVQWIVGSGKLFSSSLNDLTYGKYERGNLGEHA